MLTFEKFGPLFVVGDHWEVRFIHYPDKDLPAIRHAIGANGLIQRLPAAHGVTICNIESKDGSVGHIGTARCSLSEKVFSRSKGRKHALAHAVEYFPKKDRALFWYEYFSAIGDFHIALQINSKWHVKPVSFEDAPL